MDPARILIVDDDPDICEAMKVVLENEGYTVQTAGNSKQATKQLAASIPGLIILDVMMESMQEGFVFARDLKKNEKYHQIPILMLTSIKDKTGIDFKPEAGNEAWLPVDEFIDKPVKPEVLLEKVGSLLKR
jgi:CheY-like chemotaxis protein